MWHTVWHLLGTVHIRLWIINTSRVSILLKVKWPNLLITKEMIQDNVTVLNVSYLLSIGYLHHAFTAVLLL